MKLHFIAIGGSIMHSLAIAMQKQGHEVTGSDDEIYEPSRTRLADRGLLPLALGWHPESIHPDLDIVVLGMHARKDNPELIRAQELDLRIESFPEFMYTVSSDKTRIMVAGSHGKTTTSGMIAHVLHENGIKADRMIGAQVSGLDPVSITDAPVIVLEGDEYLSSPLDSRPKFLHYHPQITIITGIAWDHMNVFPRYEDYVKQFRLLIESLQPTDTLIYCAEDKDLVDLVAQVNPPCRKVACNVHGYEIIKDVVKLISSDGDHIPLKIFGRHNMMNLQAARLALEAYGLSSDQFYHGIQSFTGADRRLQVLMANESHTAYLDFAHAPSKVKATVEAVREKHPEAHLVACLELHSFSSLNPAFLPQYAGSMRDADVRIVYYSPHTLAMKKLPDLTPALLAGYFNDPELIVVTSTEDLKANVLQSSSSKPSALLWMSSGRFDGMNLGDVSRKWMQRNY